VPRQCFVICAFGEPGSRVRCWSDFLVANIIRPAAGSDYEVSRTIDVPMGGDITARIHRELRTAEMVVADLTEGNTNVAYELGIRHALGRPYVLVCRSDTQPPFDLRNLSTVFVDATYVEGKNKYLMAEPARVAAELAEQMKKPFVSVPDNYRVRAFDWTTTYSPTVARDWLGRQDRSIQDAIKAFEGNEGISDECRHDEPLMTKFAEYLEMKTSASQKYKGQLFYFLDPRNRLEAGYAIYRFPTSTSTIDASGKEEPGEGAIITFDQPSREVRVAGLKVALPCYEFSVKFNRRAGSEALVGDMRHPHTDTLVGRSELMPKWGLGL
jgi:hypothetical protein